MTTLITSHLFELLYANNLAECGGSSSKFSEAIEDSCAKTMANRSSIAGNFGSDFKENFENYYNDYYTDGVLENSNILCEHMSSIENNSPGSSPSNLIRRNTNSLIESCFDESSRPCIAHMKKRIGGIAAQVHDGVLANLDNTDVSRDDIFS